MHFSHVSIQAKKEQFSLLKRFWSVVRSGVFLQGQQVVQLEAKLAEYFPNGHVTACGSGHDALVLALMACHLKKTDQVLFPVNSYPTAFPVALSGAVGVPVDVDENGQLDVKDLEKKITKQTKVVIVVHLYGLVGELSKIKALCRRHKLILIEDCAQSFGTLYKGEPVGTWGDFGCFSFYPTKNLGTLGDGGAVWSKSPVAYEYIIQAKSYGEKDRYNSQFLAAHSRLPELQAAALNIFIDEFIPSAHRKIELARYFRQKLKNQFLSKEVRVLETHKNSLAIQHLLVVEVNEREALRDFLARHGVQTMVHYPRSINQVKAFETFFKRQKNKSFPMAERLARRCISLPFHQFLRFEDIDTLVRLMAHFYKMKNVGKK